VQGRRGRCRPSRARDHHVEKRFTFTPVAGHHDIGLCRFRRSTACSACSTASTLLALHALSQAGEQMGLDVPAVLFDALDARQTVELFVTINAKHTRLNPCTSSVCRPQALSRSRGNAGPSPTT